VRTHRRSYRERRAAAPIPVVALVGYTNAGKSTLLNALTRAGVLAEDKLFATLDPTTRRLELPGGQAVLFTDTVGFIQKLPTQVRVCCITHSTPCSGGVVVDAGRLEVCCLGQSSFAGHGPRSCSPSQHHKSKVPQRGLRAQLGRRYE
jgi:predicted ATPase